MLPVGFNSKNVNRRGNTCATDHRALQCQQKRTIRRILQPPFTKPTSYPPFTSDTVISQTFPLSDGAIRPEEYAQNTWKMAANGTCGYSDLFHTSHIRLTGWNYRRYKRCISKLQAQSILFDFDPLFLYRKSDDGGI